MRKHRKRLLLAFFAMVCLILIAPGMLLADTDWLFFARDINSASTKYYYDLESVRYHPDDRVSASIKIGNAREGQILSTEINCTGHMFRINQPPIADSNGWWGFFDHRAPVKTQQVVSGWLEISPDSEMNVLRRQLCNYPKKDWN